MPDQDRVAIEIPRELVQLFEAEADDVCAALGAAARAGIGSAAQVEDPAAPTDESAEALRDYRRRSLVHYFGKFWYLATEVALLRREMSALEPEIRGFGGDPT